LDADLAARRRRQLLDELPPGASLEAIADCCRNLDRMTSAVGGVCRGGEHSTAAAEEWLFNSELYSVRAEVLAWLESVGGTCDCTIRARALPAVLRLSRELWE
jgi:hypothetical protein